MVVSLWYNNLIGYLWGINMDNWIWPDGTVSCGFCGKNRNGELLDKPCSCSKGDDEE